jgi:hypothetical protein
VLPSYDEATTGRDATTVEDEIEDVELPPAPANELSPTDPEVLKAGFKEFENYLTSSNALRLFRENLRYFVFPSFRSYASAVLGEHVPRSARISQLKCKVHWKVLEYYEKEMDSDGGIEDILTVSGSPDRRTEAAPCGEYMQQRWGRTGAKMLEAFNYSLKTRRCSKSHQWYSLTSSAFI